MSIGLSRVDLLETFTKSLRDIQTKLNVEQITFDMGVNPEAKPLIEAIKIARPKLSSEDAEDILCFLLAFLEVIATNNDSIAKSVPHIER